MNIRNQVFAILLLACGLASAQILEPVSWSTSVRTLEGGRLELVASAKIDAGWHVYSQFIGSDGPIPTTFMTPDSKDLVVQRPVREPKPIIEFDKNFGMELAYFSKKVDFVIDAKRKNQSAFTYTAEVDFMVCDDARCLPPELVSLTFKVPASSEPNQGLTAAQAENTDPELPAGSSQESAPLEPEIDAASEPTKPSPEVEKAEAFSLWSLFGAGMLGGFLALIMPCIFPMIPLTVSFFLKQSKSKADGIRKALLYGLSINVIYVVLGLLVTVTFGSDALNAMATNPWFNLAFFVLFVVFALSFFGLFEITLSLVLGQ
jgi:thiol:disulfide interchange protein DsbD